MSIPSYQNYFSTGYQPIGQQGYPSYQQPTYNQSQIPQPMQVQQPQNNNSLIWVQGIEGAKSYLVGAGQSVLLMDSENQVFYIKSTDSSGMPLPLRVFAYTEQQGQTMPNSSSSNTIDMSGFVTREEFENRIAELIPNKQIERKEDVKYA